MASRCEVCGAIIRDSAKFCSECGSPIEQKCPQCGASVTGSKFCSECGADLRKSTVATRKKAQNSSKRKATVTGRGKKNDLINYLAMIIDMEKNIYLQDELLNSLKTKSNSLCQRGAPIAPSIGQKSKEGVPILIRGILGIIIGVVCFVLYDNQKQYYLQHISENLHSTNDNLQMVYAFGILIGMVYGIYSIVRGILYSIDDMSTNRKNRNTNERNATKYQNDLAEYRHQMSIEKAKKTAIDSSIHKVETELQNSRRELQELYDINVIYPTYRGWANVCSLYDYLASGMCKTLEEAYKVLVAHIDAGEIITRLDNVIRSLDIIKSNQVTLFNSIEESNRTVERLVSSTDGIAEQVSKLQGETSQMNRKLEELNRTSALTAYYEERNSIQLKYMNQKNYYSENYAHRTFVDDLPPD